MKNISNRFRHIGVWWKEKFTDTSANKNQFYYSQIKKKYININAEWHRNRTSHSISLYASLLSIYNRFSMCSHLDSFMSPRTIKEQEERNCTREKYGRDSIALHWSCVCVCALSNLSRLLIFMNQFNFYVTSCCHNSCALVQCRRLTPSFFVRVAKNQPLAHFHLLIDNRQCHEFCAVSSHQIR